MKCASLHLGDERCRNDSVYDGLCAVHIELHFAEAERDAALAALQRVTDLLDVHDVVDPSGWMLKLADVRAAVAVPTEEENP